MRAEERKAQTLAAADRTLKEDEADLVIARLVELCTPLEPAMQQCGITPKQKQAALLKSKKMGGITVPRTAAEIRSCIYEHRKFVISTFALNKLAVYAAIEVQDELQSRQCCTCNINDVDTGNPIILCDGCNDCFHIGCEGLEYMPDGDWICQKCEASDLHLIDCILDKRDHRGRVEYLIRWVRHRGDNSDNDDERVNWQAVADIPKGKQSFAMQKITEFNRTRRENRLEL